LDVESGEAFERRFAATREELNDWAMPLQGKLAAVAIEATTGWRWVWRQLSAQGFDVRLVDPAQAKALRGVRAVRAAGLDPVVDESGESRRRGRLAKHGAPALRWALTLALIRTPDKRQASATDHARGSRSDGPPSARTKPAAATVV
jgi:transposase